MDGCDVDSDVEHENSLNLIAEYRGPERTSVGRQPDRGCELPALLGQWQPAQAGLMGLDPRNQATPRISCLRSGYSALLRLPALNSWSFLTRCSGCC